VSGGTARSSHIVHCTIHNERYCNNVHEESVLEKHSLSKVPVMSCGNGIRTLLPVGFQLFLCFSDEDFADRCLGGTFIIAFMTSSKGRLGTSCFEEVSCGACL